MEIIDKNKLINLETLVGLPIVEIKIQDECECYSEYTTDPCNVHIEFSFHKELNLDTMWMQGSEYQLELAKIESIVEQWAYDNFEFTDCSSCNDNFGESSHPYVTFSIRLLPPKKT